MINWFKTLNWKYYSHEYGVFFSELERFADYTFENGIVIRVSKGTMANTDKEHPYEVNLRYPNGNYRSVNYLSKEELVSKMEAWHNIKTELI